MNDLRIAGGIGAKLPTPQHQLHGVASWAMNIFARISGWNARFEAAGGTGEANFVAAFF